MRMWKEEQPNAPNGRKKRKKNSRLQYCLGVKQIALQPKNADDISLKDEDLQGLELSDSSSCAVVTPSTSFLIPHQNMLALLAAGLAGVSNVWTILSRSAESLNRPVLSLDLLYIIFDLVLQIGGKWKTRGFDVLTSGDSFFCAVQDWFIAHKDTRQGGGLARRATRTLTCSAGELFPVFCCCVYTTNCCARSTYTVYSTALASDLHSRVHIRTYVHHHHISLFLPNIT